MEVITKRVDPAHRDVKKIVSLVVFLCLIFLQNGGIRNPQNTCERASLGAGLFVQVRNTLGVLLPQNCLINLMLSGGTSAALLVLALWVFRRLEPGFADVI